jgi:FAD:protein FMN transferase
MMKKNFFCMASSCEVLMETTDPILFETYFAKIKAEAERIEAKFSRYRDDNIVYQINQSQGRPVTLDTETMGIIRFAFQCYELSDGLFDITSGVLRKIWNFKNFNGFPSQKEIDSCLKNVGLEKIVLDKNSLTLKKGMEIDLGGIVKEYAVDVCLSLIPKNGPATLVNFGGDLAVNRAPQAGSWSVAIEEAFKSKIKGSQLNLKGGALATSGDTHRFFDYKGKRYSHILNPKTGMPVCNNIASITVFSENCTMAGLLATVSHLQPDPAQFLKEQETTHWIVRHQSHSM